MAKGAKFVWTTASWTAGQEQLPPSCRRGLEGARILLALPSGLEFIASFFGYMYAGAVAIPLQALNPVRMRADSRFRAIAEDCGAAVVLTTAAMERAAKPEKGTAILADLEFVSAEEAGQYDPTRWTPVALESNRLTVLQYTSGSTSVPRGVQITGSNLLAGVAAIRDTFAFDEQTAMVSWLPFYHDMGLIGSLALPVFCGGTAFSCLRVLFYSDRHAGLRLLRASGRSTPRRQTSPMNSALRKSLTTTNDISI
jgi:acyl-CoA synthetase (AMP-forming)/AMP-acid ligase II